MFVYDIRFDLKPDAEDADHALTSFLGCMSGNNQIIFETLNISGNNEYRIARVTVPYMDSLEQSYYDCYTREMFERLQPFLSKPVEISFVGEDFTYDDDICDGKEANAYVLSSHLYLEDLSPIACVECRGNVPFYLLPKLSESAQYALDSWHCAYIAYDKLFYATSVGEMHAHKMLSNASSALTKKGLEVCKLLEHELGKPVYYYLYRFYGKHKRTCPICGGDWKQPEGSAYDFRCDTCKLVSTIIVQT